MDGTLLNNEKTISERNLECIQKAVGKGVKFVLASGRIYPALSYYYDKLPQGQPLICCNGSTIIDHNKEYIFNGVIEKSKTLKIIDHLNEKDVAFHFYYKDVFCTGKFERAMSFQKNFNSKMGKNNQMEIRIIPNVKKFLEESYSQINKFVVIDDNISYLGELKKRLESNVCLEVTKSEINNLEIMEKGMTKGNGLVKLANYYGISLEECIAVGNDENDISMIKKAGLGIAVNNARDDIKAYAKYVTKANNDNDAIAEIIEKFIL